MRRFRERYNQQSDLETQQIDLPSGPDNDFRVFPDERQFAHEFRQIRGVEHATTEPSLNRTEIAPIRVRAVPIFGAVQVSNQLQLYLPWSPFRRRFIIVNPDNATENLKFCFNASQALIPLGPGALWDESGSTVCVSEIWITAKTAGHIFHGYEMYDEPVRKRR